MDMIQESFLQWLHDQDEHIRIENYNLYTSYYNGDHTVRIPRKVAAALGSELGTVTNYCRVVVDAAVDYICGGEVGLHVPGNDAGASEAEKLLYDIYDANHLLDIGLLKTATVMGKKGDVFLHLYIENDVIKVSILRPEMCFPRYSSDDCKDMLYMAKKWYDPERGKLVAEVFRAESVEYWELTGEEDSESNVWELVGEEDNILGFIPFIHIKSTIDDLIFGVSDIHVMKPLQDALNKTLTDMLLTMDNQAFQRLAIFGYESPKGNAIPVEPGSVLTSLDAEGHLDVIEASGIEPFIAALREIVSEICTVTSIPQQVTTHQGGGAVSGYALRIQYMPLERKCGKRVKILRNAFAELDQMIFKAAKLLGGKDYVGLRTHMEFGTSLPVDEKERTEIHEIELAARIKSRKTVMEERGIEDVAAELELIQEDENAIMELGTKAARERLSTESAIDSYTAGLETEAQPEE